MADKKISELNTASAVYDADDFALVQDGETKQVNASTVKAYAKDGLSKSDVGLGNVDNTSDATKNSAVATLTNKTISGSSNTLSNIGNSSLTNSSITINGNAVSLGGSTTVSAATTNTLTIGTGLSGTSFNGSAATTIAIDSSVVTLTGTQTLTNKTLTSPTINGGTVNNTAIGGTTPAAGAFTTLSSTGNTTLGDASNDTLTINGTAVSAPNGLNVNSNQLVLSGGNLGLGVPPRAWSTFKCFQLPTSAIFAYDGGTGNRQCSFGNNLYYDGVGFKYTATDYASYYKQVNGQNQWFTAPSGTAENAIGFTQNMTLDASGNLLVGKTTDNMNTAGLTLNSNGVVRATVSGDACFYANRQTSTGFVHRFYYANSAVGDISTNGTTVTFSGTASSDARLKKDIQPIGNALAAVNALEFVKFKFSSSGLNSAGVIAQQAETVEAIKPFVINGATEADYKAFDYDALLGYMGAAIQELHAEIEQLKMRIA